MTHDRKERTKRRFALCVVAVLLALSGRMAWADDLAGADRILCASVQTTYCLEGGECAIDLPWNLKLPAFIEIDLGAKTLSTTAASGENRATAIQHLSRQDGLIVLQGFEMGRAFSFVITEQTGQVAVAVAREGRAVAVFGSCTPLTGPVEPGRE